MGQFVIRPPQYYYVVMSIFDSTESLRGQSFAYGLSPFDPLSTDSEEFVESDEVAVFVDEEGKTNVAGQIILHENTDPIDCAEGAEVPTFSPENKFIQGLKLQFEGVPIGGIILYPTVNPYFNDFFSSSTQELFVVYPRDTPKGFVPCVGQRLTYGDGKVFNVVNLGTIISGERIADVRYMQRVPDGWVESNAKGIEGKILAEIEGSDEGGFGLLN